MSQTFNSIPVALTKCEAYNAPSFEASVHAVLDAIDFSPAPGTRVLVKPNLLKATPDGLTCTHPLFVRAACTYLLAYNVKITVGDSPGFGSCVGVAQKIGLTEALKDLDAPIVPFTSAKRIKLPFGYGVGIAPTALEADHVLNLPKLKVHGQMHLSLAVKNLFGCISGVRKAVAHSRHGDMGNRFESLIIEVMQALPPATALVDGIEAMHVKGPIDGQPYALKLLGASPSCVALDTALGTILKAAPEGTPLWREAQHRNLPGAHLEELHFPMLAPEEITAPGFKLPVQLKPQTFHPARLCVSACKRFWARIT